MHSGLQQINALTATDTVLYDVAKFALLIEVPMQFHRRHAPKIGSHQIDYDRPSLQQYMRVFQQCVMAKRNILATITASVWQRISHWHLVDVGSTAAKTPGKAIVPDDRFEQIARRGFVWKHSQFFDQRNTTAARLTRCSFVPVQ